MEVTWLWRQHTEAEVRVSTHLELNQAGRDGHTTDRVRARHHVDPPVQLLQLREGDYTHTHTHTLEPNTHTHTHSWGPWRWNLNVGLTLVTDSFCPPCWTETHQKETRDVMTACSDIIVTRPIGRTINVLCYTCKLWIFPLERTLSSVIN